MTSERNINVSYVVARRALALPAEAISGYEETAHLHCNKRSAAQVSAKTTPALAGGARESASQRHDLWLSSYIYSSANLR